MVGGGSEMVPLARCHVQWQPRHSVASDGHQTLIVIGLHCDLGVRTPIRSLTKRIKMEQWGLPPGLVT